MVNDSFETVLAKNIGDCDECPLFKNDCVGGWTSDGGGNPIEPPCTSWDDDTEVFQGMYPPYEPSDREIEFERLYDKERLEAKSLADKKAYLNSITETVYRLSKYGNTKVKYSGALRPDWYCPRCHNWFHPWYEDLNNGVRSTECPYCHTDLAYSGEIESRY